MGQTAHDKPFSETQRVNHQRALHNSRMGTNGAKFHGPSEDWRLRRQTGGSGTLLPSGNFEGNNLTQDKSQIRVCRHFLQGKCAHGTSCKYQHFESDKLDVFRSRGIEKLGDIVHLGSVQYRGGNVDTDLRSRSFSTERKICSPCWKFQSGWCHRGAACPYFHSESTTYLKPWSTNLKQGLASTSNNPGFGGGNMKNTKRIPHDHDEANRGDTGNLDDDLSKSFSKGCINRPPCWKFQSGRCHHGVTCPYLHSVNPTYVRPLSTILQQRIATSSRYPGFGEVNMEITAAPHKLDKANNGNRGNVDDDLKGRSSSKGNKSRFPCWQFQSGRCHRGVACPYLHSENTTYARPWSTELQQGVATTSGNPGFGECNTENTVMTPHELDVAIKGDLNTRAFSEKCRSQFHCRNFLRGRCYRGATCPYLHQEHTAHVKPWYDWSKQPHLELATASGNFGGQCVPSMMSQEHTLVRDNNVLLSEGGIGLISQDETYSEKIERPFVDGMVKPNFLDQKREVTVMTPKKYGSSGGVIASTCNSSEAANDMNVWSRSPKKQRSRSRSPCISQNDTGHDFQNNLPEPGHNNVVPYHFPSPSSHQCSMPSYHMDYSSLSKDARTFAPSCSQEVNKHSDLMETDGLDKVMNFGMRLDRYAGGGFVSNSGTSNQKSEAELAKGGVQSSYMEKENTDSKSQGHDKVMSPGRQLDPCSDGCFDLNTASLILKSETGCSQVDVETGCVKQNGKGLVTGSIKMDLSIGQNAININPGEKTEALKTYSRKRGRKKSSKCLAETMREETTNSAMQGLPSSSTGKITLSHLDIVTIVGDSVDIDGTTGNSSLQKVLTADHLTPTDFEVNELSKNNNAEVNFNLSQDRGGKTAALESNSRKKKRKKRSKRRVEPLREEATDLAMQGLPSFSVGSISLSHPDIVGVSVGTAGTAGNSSLQKVVMVHHLAPKDSEVNGLSKNSNAEVSFNLSQERGGKTEALESNSRKKKRKKRSKRRVEPLGEEATDSVMQGLSTFSAGKISLNHSDDVENSSLQKVLMVDHLAPTDSEVNGLSKGNNAEVNFNLSEERAGKTEALESNSRKRKRKRRSKRRLEPVIEETTDSAMQGLPSFSVGKISSSHPGIVSVVGVSEDTMVNIENSSLQKVLMVDPLAPMDSEVNGLSKDNNAEVKFNLSEERGGETEALGSNSRKRSKKRRSKCHVEPVREETIDPAMQVLPSFSAEKISSSHQDIASFIGVSEDATVTVENTSPQKVLMVDHLAPMDYEVNGLSKDNNAEVNFCLSEERAGNNAALGSNSRKRSRKRRSKCRVEPLREETTDPAMQGLPSFSAGEISLSHPDVMSVVGVSEDTTGIVENSSLQKVLMVDPLAPMDLEVNASNKDNNAEVKLDLSQERGGTTEAMENCFRKKKRRRCSKSCVELVREGVTDSGLQGPSSFSAGETSLNQPEIVSVEGGLEDQNAAAKDSSPQNVLLVDRTFSKSKRKLLVLDVNGLLADIVAQYPRNYKPIIRVATKGVFKRPFCDDFLQFCFQRFDVGVWSSRTKKNVDRALDFLMGDFKKQLLFCWHQSHCTKTRYQTRENRNKPLVLKELQKLWEKQADNLPWEKGYYDETNTVLVDDSPYKALCNPSYTAIFPFPYQFNNTRDNSLGPGGDLRVYLEGLAVADNTQKFIQQNPFGQQHITEQNRNWEFYSKIIKDYAKPRRKCLLDVAMT